ncbi:hypothetical protein TRIP_C90451 [Candidatus Zixiibacteriota bacterium]|nr:hypothetical protein TRIP_C90451 [candidate division Zixibacteria bacterium]
MRKPKIFENLWVKLASLILAGLLWFHVATNKVYQQDVLMPLKQVDLTGKLLLAEPPPESVMVRVTATGKKLLQSNWRTGGLKLLINRSQPGRFKTELNPSNFSLINGDKIEISEVLYPREYEFECDRKQEKRLPVRSRIVAVPDDGFAVSGPDSISPDIVTVSGPADQIKDLAYIDTKYEILKGARNDITMRIPIEKPNIYSMEIDPESVTVNVRLIPIKSKSFKGIPVRVKNAPSGRIVEVFPPKIDVRAGGLQKNIDSITSLKISAYADYNQANDRGMAPIEITLPPGISLVSRSADSVRIIKE